MKVAVVYARYSCDAQTEQSIEGQLSVCQDFAKRNDMVIVNTYIDRAMTGTNDMRPQFRQMLADSAKKEWDVVLVYKLDRFSRDKYEATVHKRTLKNNGVKVVSAMENIPDTPEGIILEALLEGMNQYYSMELAQKVKRGMRETRKKGNFQGGKPPYGYYVQDKKVHIHESRAEVVRYIFEEFTRGVTAREIIETLTERGELYNGKPFVLNTIYGILHNEKYTGTYKIGDEVVDKVYPAIISQELFDVARSICDGNKHGRKSITQTFLLSRLMVCGLCGETFVIDSGTTREGEVHYYYKCSGRKHKHNGCPNKPFRKDDLEELVINQIVEALSAPHIMDTLVANLLAFQEVSIAQHLELQKLERQYRQNEMVIQNIMEAIENGIFSKTTQKRLTALEQEQEELEIKILAEKNKMQVALTEKEIRLFYRKALKENPKLLLKHLVEKIVLYNDEIVIYFKTPLEKGPDDGQGFSFYAIELFRDLTTSGETKYRFHMRV